MTLRATSATTAAMKRARVSVTIEDYFRWNMVDSDGVDAELLDAIPAELKEDFLDHLALCEEFDNNSRRLWRDNEGTILLRRHVL